MLAGVFFAYREIKENRVQVQKLATEQAFVNNAMFKQSQQNTFYRIVDENLKAPMDEKLRFSQVVWNELLTKKVPPSLACAIWEHESHWIPTAVNPESGAIGIGQQIPRYAMPYLRAMGVEATPESLKDPAIGGVISIAQLYDYQADWVRLKKMSWSDWAFALYSYSEGGRQVSSMNMTYATEVMKLRKKYQDKGLE
jgi:soluble lytic murein transglycosylase-like protein